MKLASLIPWVIAAAALCGCSRKEADEAPHMAEEMPRKVVETSVPRIPVEASQEPRVPALAPVVQYYEKADEFTEPYRPDLTIGVCMTLSAQTQFKRYNANNKDSGTRGSGLSPFTALNNLLADAGHDRVDIDSGHVRVIRLPTHGKVSRSAWAEAIGYEPDADYLGADRLILAAEVEGKRFELRYYLHTVENFYGPKWQDPCWHLVWKIGSGSPDSLEPLPADGVGDESRLVACRFAYTKNSAGAPVRNGLSASVAVMARHQALNREWNDDLWKVRVLAAPQHGTLEPDTTLEASYLYSAEPGFSGFDRITFEVSLGPERYQVDQIVLVNSFDPDFEQHVPAALQDCPALTLPGIPRVEDDEC